MLLKPFSESGVWMALQSIGSLKSPGPDGFRALFYKKLWQLIKDEVMAMVRQF